MVANGTANVVFNETIYNLVLNLASKRMHVPQHMRIAIAFPSLPGMIYLREEENVQDINNEILQVDFT